MFSVLTLIFGLTCVNSGNGSVRTSEMFDQEWLGTRCGDEDTTDVGRGEEDDRGSDLRECLGPGSCDNDCDCPPCSPICASTGLCQNNEIFGRRPVSRLECLTSACPQPLGGNSPGCNKTFTRDTEGEISCLTSWDCPQGRGWWCEQWAARPGGHCQGSPEATLAECEGGRCVFTSDRARWVLCRDSDNTTRVRGEPSGRRLLEYSCRSSDDCELLSDDLPLPPLRLQCLAGHCRPQHQTDLQLPNCGQNDNSLRVYFKRTPRFYR